MSKVVIKRDPFKTKAKILEAAFREFVTHGRAGARIDRIARESGCNKAMIYHYYNSKDGLFDALIAKQTDVTADLSDEAVASVANGVDKIMALVTEDWVRFSMWEALESRGGRIVAEEERRVVWDSLTEQVQEFIDQGVLPAKLKASHLELAGVALFVFPTAFPQLTKLISGAAFDDPNFQNEWREFLLELLVVFSDSGQK